ncbi:glycosyltransferase family 2 protein [Albidovulum sp.]
MSEASQTPELSIVVTIVDGGEGLRDFLRAVAAFDDPPPHEVIVPYDASRPEVPAMAAEFPDVRFLDIGRIDPIYPITTEAGLHELYDRRRSRGLAAARGRIVAILEDRGHPRADWARQVVALHAETGCKVVGGAIEFREPASLLNFAFWVTDFGRYGLPFESGPVQWVSDVNISYARDALEEMRPIWIERYHEPLVNQHLLDRNETLWLSDRMVVLHGRAPCTLGRLVPERFYWGRLFGHIRTMIMTDRERWKMILLSPLIPPLLWLRHGRTQFRKGHGLRYLKALPYVMILTTAWVIGEVWGYVTRRP